MWELLGEVVDAFLELDTSKTGTIRLHEMRDVLSRFGIPDKDRAAMWSCCRISRPKGGRSILLKGPFSRSQRKAGLGVAFASQHPGASKVGAVFGVSGSSA